ncbi:NblA/ycf18 family protein [Planktothrix sp.]|uniref:NblA/ycf18 family protein n=1 Tax=Planktothrix sp. TaxID=3088171 RepID=UPI0038D4BE5B
MQEIQSPGLSLEQQFKLKMLNEQVKTLNLEQAQDYLMELLKQSMIKDNLLKQWIKGV